VGAGGREVERVELRLVDEREALRREGARARVGRLVLHEREPEVVHVGDVIHRRGRRGERRIHGGQDGGGAHVLGARPLERALRDLGDLGGVDRVFDLLAERHLAVAGQDRAELQEPVEVGLGRERDVDRVIEHRRRQIRAARVARSKVVVHPPGDVVVQGGRAARRDRERRARRRGRIPERERGRVVARGGVDGVGGRHGREGDGDGGRLGERLGRRLGRGVRARYGRGPARRRQGQKRQHSTTEKKRVHE
jgi:hypothetical protein